MWVTKLRTLTLFRPATICVNGTFVAGFLIGPRYDQLILVWSQCTIFVLCECPNYQGQLQNWRFITWTITSTLLAETRKELMAGSWNTWQMNYTSPAISMHTLLYTSIVSFWNWLENPFMMVFETFHFSSTHATKMSRLYTTRTCSDVLWRIVCNSLPIVVSVFLVWCSVNQHLLVTDKHTYLKYTHRCI